MGKYTELQREAYEANMQIPAQHLALYTWGNVSAFDKDAGVFAIKPSGVPYPDLTADSMVIVDIEGNVLSSEKIESKAKKTYANLIKSGNIDPAETSFSDYVNDVKSEYITVYDLIDFIRGEEQESEHETEPEEGDFREMPEPFEPDAEEIPE